MQCTWESSSWTARARRPNARAAPSRVRRVVSGRATPSSSRQRRRVLAPTLARSSLRARSPIPRASAEVCHREHDDFVRPHHVDDSERKRRRSKRRCIGDVTSSARRAAARERRATPRALRRLSRPRLRADESLRSTRLRHRRPCRRGSGGARARGWLARWRDSRARISRAVAVGTH